MSRPYGEGSVYRRASDGRWIGTVEVAGAGKRRRLTVSALDRKRCLARLVERRQAVEEGVVPPVRAPRALRVPAVRARFDAEAAMEAVEDAFLARWYDESEVLLDD